MQHETTLHNFRQAPLYLAKKDADLVIMQGGVLMDLNMRQLGTAYKLFPFDDTYSAGIFPSAVFARTDGTFVAFEGASIEIPANSLVFGFFKRDERAFCAFQMGIMDLAEQSCIEFPQYALSCDICGSVIAAGFEDRVMLFTFYKGALYLKFSQQTESPVVEVRLSSRIFAYKCANNEFCCGNLRDGEVGFRQQFTCQICSICCIGSRLLVSNAGGEVLVFANEEDLSDGFEA